MSDFNEMKVIKYQFTKSPTLEEKEMDEHDKSLLIFKYLRPYLIKLFLHMILLFLSIRGFYSYKNSTDSYEIFKDTLNKELITDVKLIDYVSPCPENYTDIDSTIFPEVKNGCRCDFKIYPEEICKFFEAYNNSILRKNLENNCKIIDMDKSNGIFRKLFDINHLSKKFEFDIENYLPKKCNCFQIFQGISKNKTIDRFFPNKRICIIKEKSISTLQYLKTAMNPCSDEFRCQNYFCAEKFPSKKCPIIDIIPTRLRQSNSSKSTNQSYDIDFSIKTIYDTNLYDKESFENTIFLPILNLRITRNGKCNLNQDNNLLLDYSTIKNIDCPIDQRVHNFFYSELKTVLNSNDNYYEELTQKLPLFDIIVNKEVKWGLGLEYAFYRKTVGCLLEKFDDLNKNFLFEKKEKKGNMTNFDVKKKKLEYLLIVFVNYDLSYNFQAGIQIGILIINSCVIFFNIVIIIIRIMKVCYKESDRVIKIIRYEYIISFILDIVIAVLGGTSFFLIGKFSEYVNYILETDCLDNYLQYQFGLFNDSLQNTMDQNLQIFIFMLFKLFLILFFVVFYMMYRKCSFRWNTLKRVIQENINEGENMIDIEEIEKISKPKNKITKQISLVEIEKVNNEGSNKILDKKNEEIILISDNQEKNIIIEELAN